jgi:pimeloyl-ACP methyl ester carboxylesterase
MQTRHSRRKVHFTSGGERCAAWHHPGTNGAGIVMAPGYGVTKEAGTDRYARAFSDAGYSVLAFDYRRFGESGGQPRHVARVREQLADWDAAIAHGATLPDVDPNRLAIWAYSLSGAHAFPVAARHPELAAAVAISAPVDGAAASRNAIKHQAPGALLRASAIGLLDALGARFGRDPRLIALTGERGTVAMLTAPDALNGPRALNAEHYPEWEQVIAARSALRVGFYRPGRYARRVQCPLLVMTYEQDDVAPAAPAVRAGERAPNGQVVSQPGGHFQFLLDGYEQALDTQLTFLQRHLLATQPIRSRKAPA